MLLVGWPIPWADLATVVANIAIDYTCVALVVAATLHMVEQRADWSRGRRRGLLVVGLALAVATQLLPDTGSVFRFDPAMALRLERAGINCELPALRLYQLWFSVILVTASAIYLTQRRDSMAAEQRCRQLEAQGLQARRHVRMMRDAAGSARLDPRVLFDCLGLARNEYLRDAARADALLDRLIDFLRDALSGTRSLPRTLGEELGQAVRFAAILELAGELRVHDEVPAALRQLEVCPGLLSPLVQQWLAACAEDGADRPLRIDAGLAGPDLGELWVSLSGPRVALEAGVSESRGRLADLYGARARVHAAVAGTPEAPRLDIRFELPLGMVHAV